MQKPNRKSSNRITRFKSRSNNQELHNSRFIIGELYLFHPTKKYCPAKSSLWGIYDKREDGIIYLESSSFDLVHFKLWHRLPEVYRYSRRATRRELSDYMYNLGHRDSRIQHLNVTKQIPKLMPQSLFLCPRVRYSFPRDMSHGNA